jgi:phage-related minor tail protein
VAENSALIPPDFTRELGGVSDELTRISSLADGVARSITGAFRSAVSDGKSLNGVLGDIARSFADLALKAALKPVGQAISGFVENLFTATNPALGGVKPFAKGGVIAAPTYFPLGAGMGVAGEAGPEAIMPLQRGPDGRLGIAGAGGAVTVNFNVTSPDARSFSQSEAELSAMLLRAVRRGTRGS